MTIVKSMIIAFAMYSRIPMPKVEWDDKSMRYSLCFFPAVGIAVGLLELLWWKLCLGLEAGLFLRTLTAAVLPVIISGGIHIDGYMDTMDAFHSYQPRETRLLILKDPHIGAFSVIMLTVYYALYLGALSELEGQEILIIWALGFVLSRALSGLALVWFTAAKKEGLLYSFASTAHKTCVRICMIAFAAVCIVLMILLHPLAGIAVGTGNLLLFAYYRYKSYRMLAGITGDLAGWFLSLSELVTAGLLAAAVLI